MNSKELGRRVKNQMNLILWLFAGVCKVVLPARIPRKHNNINNNWILSGENALLLFFQDNPFIWLCKATAIIRYYSATICPQISSCSQGLAFTFVTLCRWDVFWIFNLKKMFSITSRRDHLQSSTLPSRQESVVHIHKIIANYLKSSCFHRSLPGKCFWETTHHQRKRDSITAFEVNNIYDIKSSFTP